MKNRIILVSISILLVIGLIFVLNNETKKTFVIDGIKYAVNLDGEATSTVPSKGLYEVTVTCENATGKWDYDNWKLKLTNMSSEKASCSLDFTTITKVNLNDYIISLSGQTQGTGQVVHEKIYKENWQKLSEDEYLEISTDTEQGITYQFIDEKYKINLPSSYGFIYFVISSFSEDYDMKLCFENINEEANGGIYDENGSLIARITGNNCTYISNQEYITIDYGNITSDSIYVWVEYSTDTNEVESSAGYRYEGKNPNNYIWFNNELWRIIGVFDEDSHGVSGQNLVKIIREDSIGGLTWDKEGSNDWSASSLKSLLNGAYYDWDSNKSNVSTYCYGYSTIPGNCDYSEIGITDTYRNMIENVTWYLRSGSWELITAIMSYKYERTRGQVFENNPTETTGYIGLMYPSDYGYSVLASSCARTTNLGSYGSSSCAGQSWLYKTGYEWTITPVSSSDNEYREIYIIDNYGYIMSGALSAEQSASIRPVLYLSSSVYKITGDGTISNPYIIGM